MRWGWAGQGRAGAGQEHRGGGWGVRVGREVYGQGGFKFVHIAGRHSPSALASCFRVTAGDCETWSPNASVVFPGVCEPLDACGDENDFDVCGEEREFHCPILQQDPGEFTSLHPAHARGLVRAGCVCVAVC